MKDVGLLPSSASGGSAADGGLFFGKGRYKFWAFAAILLLAFWTIVTGSASLRWSASDLARLADGIDSPIHDDFDVLEVEEREQVVRHMWDVYAHSRRTQLPRFWREAFGAAYEEMASDDPAARDAAVSEIAKMSMRIVDVEPSLSRNFRINDEKDGQEVVTNEKSRTENR